MSLTAFRTLGRSGLVVSPFALGTMTFGAPKWGSTDEVSQSIFNAYVDAGGNFIDTADVYAKGHSEEVIGAAVADRSLRDKLVLATKFTFSAETGNPNAGGNGRKNLHRALEGSLRRLRTDYVDLYWMHFWDMVTPVEEMLESLGDLQRSGKIRYFAFSDLPAWYAVKAATLAQAHALPCPVALQMEYSLVERSIEREHVPAARECGLGICTWGPLAAGFLSGKYGREGSGVTGQGRFEVQKPFRQFTDQAWGALDALRKVAAEMDRTPAEVAVAWAAAQPGVTTVIVGASKLEQLQSNLTSADIRFSEEQLRVLEESSAPANSSMGFTATIQRMIFGGVEVRGWQ